MKGHHHRSILTAIATAAVGLGLSYAPALAAPVVVPAVGTLCYAGSNVYSPFYSLRITAPRHLPVTTTIDGGYVMRCRAAYRVATLFTARYLAVVKGGAEPGILTIAVGGRPPAGPPWSLGRVTCNYRLVPGVAEHRAVRCTHGGTVVTFSSPA
jgi:hypothetical protein